MNLKGFIQWYEDAYSRGDMNAEVMLQCAAYLEGFDDASGGSDGMKRASSALRGAANLIEMMRRNASNNVSAEE